MKHPFRIAGVATMAISLLPLMQTPARAQAAGGGPTYGRTDAQADIETEVTRGPNRGLLSGGALTFALPYAASVVVAATSTRSEDSRLYIPVAGPWLDLAQRGSCGEPASSACTTETWNQILLIGNGVLQGAGVLAMASSLLFPQTKVETRFRSAAPKLRIASVSPVAMPRGAYGIGLFGTF